MNAKTKMFDWKRDIVILIALQVILGSIYIGSVPRIYVDEVLDSSLGYNLAYSGALKHPFVEGMGGMNIHFVQNKILLPLVCAVIFKVAGYSIATSRIGSLVFAVLACVSLYTIIYRWFGGKQAFWVALSTIIQPWFFESSRRARPDIYYMALALVFLWLLVLFFDSGSRRIAFLVGILAGLLGLTHPNGLILTFSISCAVIFWFGVSSIGRLIKWASLGFVVVTLPYIIYVFWAIQDPRVSLTEQMLTHQLHRFLLRGEIHRWKNFFKWPKGAPLAVVMFISWIAAWFRSSRTDKTLATIILLFALVLPFATVNITSRYLVAIIPFFVALMIRLFWRVMEGGGAILRNWFKFRFVISVSMAVIYFSTSITAIVLMFYHLRGADFYKVIDRVSSTVSPNSRIYGDPIFWVGHDRYQYGPYLITYEEILLKEAIEWAHKYNFEYVVRSAWSFEAPKGLANPPQSMPDFRDECLGDHICRIFGTKIDEFRDPYYGPIEIYKLNWDKLY